MLKLPKNEDGFIDPLSLIAVSFLVLTLLFGTIQVLRNQNPLEKAADQASCGGCNGGFEMKWHSATSTCSKSAIPCGTSSNTVQTATGNSAANCAGVWCADCGGFCITGTSQTCNQAAAIKCPSTAVTPGAPVCNATSKGAVVVNGSGAAGQYYVQCNGTSWVGIGDKTCSSCLTQIAPANVPTYLQTDYQTAITAQKAAIDAQNAAIAAKAAADKAAADAAYAAAHPQAPTSASCGVGYIAEGDICRNSKTGQTINYYSIILYNAAIGNVNTLSTTEKAYLTNACTTAGNTGCADTNFLKQFALNSLATNPDTNGTVSLHDQAVNVNTAKTATIALQTSLAKAANTTIPDYSCSSANFVVKVNPLGATYCEEDITKIDPAKYTVKCAADGTCQKCTLGFISLCSPLASTNAIPSVQLTQKLATTKVNGLACASSSECGSGNCASSWIESNGSKTYSTHGNVCTYSQSEQDAFLNVAAARETQTVKDVATGLSIASGINAVSTLVNPATTANVTETAITAAGNATTNTAATSTVSKVAANIFTTYNQAVTGTLPAATQILVNAGTKIAAAGTAAYLGVGALDCVTNVSQLVGKTSGTLCNQASTMAANGMSLDPVGFTQSVNQGAAQLVQAPRNIWDTLAVVKTIQKIPPAVEAPIAINPITVKTNGQIIDSTFVDNTVQPAITNIANSTIQTIQTQTLTRAILSNFISPIQTSTSVFAPVIAPAVNSIAELVSPPVVNRITDTKPVVTGGGSGFGNVINTTNTVSQRVNAILNSEKTALPPISKEDLTRFLINSIETNNHIVLDVAQRQKVSDIVAQNYQNDNQSMTQTVSQVYKIIPDIIENLPPPTKTVVEIPSTSNVNAPRTSDLPPVPASLLDKNGNFLPQYDPKLQNQITVPVTTPSKTVPLNLTATVPQTIPQKIITYLNTNAVQPVVNFLKLGTVGIKPKTQTEQKAEKVASIVDNVFKSNFPNGDNQPGCRKEYCDTAANFVASLAREEGLQAGKYSIESLNEARNFKGLSFEHIIVIGGDAQELYLFDPTLVQFIDSQTGKISQELLTGETATSTYTNISPIVKEISRHGYIKLTDDSLNEYLDIVSSGNATDKLTLSNLSQVKEDIPVLFTRDEIVNYQYAGIMNLFKDMNNKTPTQVMIFDFTIGDFVPMTSNGIEIIPPKTTPQKIVAAVTGIVTNFANDIKSLVTTGKFGSPLPPGTNVNTNESTTSRVSINKGVQDVVDIVDQAITIERGPRNVACRQFACGFSSDLVGYQARQFGLMANNYNVLDINNARNIPDTYSEKHAFTIVIDRNGDPYLVDLTFVQFMNKKSTDPISTALLNDGYFKLTSQNFNSYINLLTSYPNPQTIGLSILNKVSPSNMGINPSDIELLNSISPPSQSSTAKSGLRIGDIIGKLQFGKPLPAGTNVNTNESTTVGVGLVSTKPDTVLSDRSIIKIDPVAKTVTKIPIPESQFTHTNGMLIIGNTAFTSYPNYIDVEFIKPADYYQKFGGSHDIPRLISRSPDGSYVTELMPGVKIADFKGTLTADEVGQAINKLTDQFNFTGMTHGDLGASTSSVTNNILIETLSNGTHVIHFINYRGSPTYTLDDDINYLLDNLRKFLPSYQALTKTVTPTSNAITPSSIRTPIVIAPSTSITQPLNIIDTISSHLQDFVDNLPIPVKLPKNPTDVRILADDPNLRHYGIHIRGFYYGTSKQLIVDKTLAHGLIVKKYNLESLNEDPVAQIIDWSADYILIDINKDFSMDVSGPEIAQAMLDYNARPNLNIRLNGDYGTLGEGTYDDTLTNIAKGLKPSLFVPKNPNLDGGSAPAPAIPPTTVPPPQNSVPNSTIPEIVNSPLYVPPSEAQKALNFYETNYKPGDTRFVANIDGKTVIAYQFDLNGQKYEVKSFTSPYYQQGIIDGQNFIISKGVSVAPTTFVNDATGKTFGVQRFIDGPLSSSLNDANYRNAVSSLKSKGVGIKDTFNNIVYSPQYGPTIIDAEQYIDLNSAMLSVAQNPVLADNYKNWFTLDEAKAYAQSATPQSQNSVPLSKFTGQLTQAEVDTAIAKLQASQNVNGIHGNITADNVTIETRPSGSHIINFTNPSPNPALNGNVYKAAETNSLKELLTPKVDQNSLTLAQKINNFVDVSPQNDLVLADLIVHASPQTVQGLTGPQIVQNIAKKVITYKPPVNIIENNLISVASSKPVKLGNLFKDASNLCIRNALACQVVAEPFGVTPDIVILTNGQGDFHATLEVANNAFIEPLTGELVNGQYYIDQGFVRNTGPYNLQDVNGFFNRSKSLPTQGTIEISKIKPYETAVTRDAQEKYSVMISSGEKIDPVEVTIIDGQIYSISGTNRIVAALKAGQNSIDYRYIPFEKLPSGQQKFMSEVAKGKVLGFDIPQTYTTDFPTAPYTLLTQSSQFKRTSNNQIAQKVSDVIQRITYSFPIQFAIKGPRAAYLNSLMPEAQTVSNPQTLQALYDQNLNACLEVSYSCKLTLDKLGIKSKIQYFKNGDNYHAALEIKNTNGQVIGYGEAETGHVENISYYTDNEWSLYNGTVDIKEVTGMNEPQSPLNFGRIQLDIHQGASQNDMGRITQGVLDLLEKNNQKLEFGQPIAVVESDRIESKIYQYDPSAPQRIFEVSLRDELLKKAKEQGLDLGIVTSVDPVKKTVNIARNKPERNILSLFGTPKPELVLNISLNDGAKTTYYVHNISLFDISGYKPQYIFY